MQKGGIDTCISCVLNMQALQTRSVLIAPKKVIHTSVGARVGVNDKVRVVDGLTQSNKDIEDMRVVVQNRAILQIRVELRLGLGIERLVKIFFAFVHRVVPKLDKAWREHNVLGPVTV